MFEEKQASQSKVEQALAWIRSHIDDNVFEGGRLPSEPKLAEQMGISRGTIRQAIEQLVQEGLLVRRHGSGTFIKQNVLGIHTRLEEVWDFAEMIRESGYTPGVRHKFLTLGKPSPAASEALQLTLDGEALTTENIFFADKMPVIYCIDVIPANLVKHAYHPAELHGPVYTFLDRRCGQHVEYNITEVLPVTANERFSLLLGCEMHSPLHLFIETGYNASDLPIIYSEEYYRPEFFSFKVVRKMVPQGIRKTGLVRAAAGSV
jgi:GntR family transcriptional regulator